MPKFLKIAALTWLFLGGYSSAHALNPFSAVTKNQTVPTSFADVVEPLLPSVVNISTTTDISNERRMPPGFSGSPLEEFFRHFMEEGPGGRGLPRKTSSLGSGFIIAQKGDEAFIVTCNHVIADADEIKVILHDDNYEFKAEVVGRDRRTDLALLKIKTDKKLVAAEWGDSSKLRVGDWTIAIGNPFGLSSTVTTGIISTLARDIDEQSRGLLTESYIQTDASINQGNSGGPMFDINGKVIAISTAIFSPNGGSIGIGFGIPSELARNVTDQLMERGRTQRGWLGVSVQSVTSDKAEILGLKIPQGALVGEIAPKSPAEKAGIKIGDVIIKFNGTDIKESRHLPRIVGRSPMGQPLPMVIWREKQEKTVMVELAEVENVDSDGLMNSEKDEADAIRKQPKVLGIAAQELTPKLRDRYRVADDIKGIIITYIDPNSEAIEGEDALRPGDIIQKAFAKDKQMDILKPEDFQQFVAAAKKNKMSRIMLQINRQGKSGFVTLKLTEPKTNE